MKRFLSTSALVAAAAVVMLLVFGPDRSVTAENPLPASANQPIRVVGVNFNTSGSKSKANWIDGMEVQIENISGKPIQYLLIHADIPLTASAENTVRVPLVYGQAPVLGVKSTKVETLRPGAKANLKAPKTICGKEVTASGRIPSPKEVQTSINIVIFEDRMAWMAGKLNYPDPANPLHWIAAEELVRNRLNSALGMNYVKTSYNSDANLQSCFVFTGLTIEACCDGIYAGNASFVSDPFGNVRPNEAEFCCSPGNCCTYTEVADCS